MHRNVNLVLFGIATLSLLALLWFLTGSIIPSTGPEMIWFHTGLLALIISRFVVEHRFTTPNDVFLNSLAVFVSISTLSSPPLDGWWSLLRWSAFACGAGAILISWDMRKSPDDPASPLRRGLYLVVTSFGQSTVIFSLVFVLAILSYFQLDSAITKAFVICWGAILIVANIRIERFVDLVFSRRRHTNLGHAVSLMTPRTIFFERNPNVRLATHQLVGLKNPSDSAPSAVAMIVGERRSPSRTWYAANLLGKSIGECEVASAAQIVSVEEDEAAQLIGEDAAALLPHSKTAVGLVNSGTTISTLNFEVFGNPSLTTGALLEAATAGGHVYYQLFDGLVSEEASLEKSERAFVCGHAEQIGQWDNPTRGFKTYGWVANETSPVSLVGEEEAPLPIELQPEEVAIGKIPKSNFPAILSISDFTLYHSAILGVTGSGKSFLTFEIIECAAEKSIKVVCIDPTGDYQRYLPNAVLIKSHKALKLFLDSADHQIGILETAINKTNPIEQTFSAAEICLEWCKANRKEEEIIKPEPKILFVMEEAHLLVPEWNFNPVKSLQDRVNLTSQVVLQARKYGLGFLVVAQRTANVLKSVLNQCNTIIALQQFDQTGFDFLANYMGRHHVLSLPNLRERHGIIVGKASNSQRPILVRFNDQQRQINGLGVPDMPEPEEGPVGAAAGGPKITPAQDLGLSGL